jgi:hypothetical protein
VLSLPLLPPWRLRGVPRMSWGVGTVSGRGVGLVGRGVVLLPRWGGIAGSGSAWLLRSSIAKELVSYRADRLAKFQLAAYCRGWVCQLSSTRYGGMCRSPRALLFGILPAAGR